MLSKSYGFDRRMLNQAIGLLVELDTVSVEAEQAMGWALDRQKRGADLPVMS